MIKTICDLQTGEIIDVQLNIQEIEEQEKKKSIQDAKAIELAKTQYQRDREAEYPPAADYLDGIVKGDQEQVQAYINACLAVKAKYPKPE